MKKIKRNFIAGEWLDGASAEDNINPSDTSDIIGEYAHASVAQTEQAIDAAYQAASVWKNSSIQYRSDMLDNIGSEILRRREEIGELVSREEGKHESKVLVRRRERVRFLNFLPERHCARVESLLIRFDLV